MHLRLPPRFLALLLPVLGALPAFAADERNELIGVWRGSMPRDPEGSIELTITATTISGRDPRTGRSLGSGPYVLEPAGHGLDATKLSSPTSSRGKLYRGLYALEGKTLKWCTTSRRERPTALEHRPGHDQYLMVLQKQR